MTDAPFLVRIWGARGSLPAPAAENCEFGTDSPCVEIRCGSHILVFDVGSGAESLGVRLMRESVKEFDIFLSHCHLDHIIGLPFMKPLYDPSVHVRLYAGHFLDDMTCREMAERFMAPPFFPITPKVFHAHVAFKDFRPPAALKPRSGIAISTVRLNHPNGSVGYRIDYAGKSVCYITDHEHVPGHPDPALLAMIRGAEIMIYDCMYTDAEFTGCQGYGHSTWQEGVRLCEAAGVERLVIFHHRPGRDDDALKLIETEAKARFPGAIVARTGLELLP
jgi:phosphoribosyl 1,2-cyclic phosphodiesterase